MALIEIRDIHKSFGEHAVFKGLSLEVEEHQVVCLIGPSGCGKSTLLRCVNGLEEIESGEIRIHGDRMTGPGVDVNALRRDVGIVFQSFNLFPHMTRAGEHHPGADPRAALPRPRSRGRRAMALLKRIGLDHKATEYPEQLSGGQQQRVALARALVGSPEVHAARRDHLGARPRAGVGGARRISATWPAQGMTMVLATHEMGFARDVAYTVCFLHEGVVHE